MIYKSVSGTWEEKEQNILSFKHNDDLKVKSHTKLLLWLKSLQRHSQLSSDSQSEYFCLVLPIAGQSQGLGLHLSVLCDFWALIMDNMFLWAQLTRLHPGWKWQLCNPPVAVFVVLYSSVGSMWCEHCQGKGDLFAIGPPKCKVKQNVLQNVCVCDNQSLLVVCFLLPGVHLKILRPYLELQGSQAWCGGSSCSHCCGDKLERIGVTWKGTKRIKVLKSFDNLSWFLMENGESLVSL